MVKKTKPTPKTAAAERTAARRRLMTVYYSGAERVKTNSSSNMKAAVDNAKRTLQYGSYGADRAEVIQRSNKQVKHAFALKDGKVVPVLQSVKRPHIAHPSKAREVVHTTKACPIVRTVFLRDAPIGNIQGYRPPTVTEDSAMMYMFAPTAMRMDLMPAKTIVGPTWQSVLQQVRKILATEGLKAAG